MEIIWIIGIGQFGYLAYQRLSKDNTDKQFVLVDPVEENLARCQGPRTTLAPSDGVSFLEEHLKPGQEPHWIIPALPVHLAAEYFLRHLGPERIRRIPVPLELDRLLPNPRRESDGNLYVSHADFRCPDNCDEPKDLCTITRKKRKKNMFEVIGEIQLERYRAMVIRSHQLGPGIGGYRPEQLFELRHRVERSKGPLLVGTACRCHGVITGLELVS